MKTNKDIKSYIKEAHQDALDHGWWDNPKSFPELISLVHSELSEALEEHRNHQSPNETYYSGSGIEEINQTDQRDQFAIQNYGLIKQIKYISNTPLGHYKDTKLLKPEGIPSELADAVIRIFDMCGYYGIDLEKAIDEKMAYNKTRSYKHGGKKL